MPNENKQDISHYDTVKLEAISQERFPENNSTIFELSGNDRYATFSSFAVSHHITLLQWKWQLVR